MAGLEIERKFLVVGDSYKQMSFSHSHIRQGYLCADGKRTVRVRLRDYEGFLTIKGPSSDGGLSRYEFETKISPMEAAELFRLCEPGAIDKIRYLVRSDSGHVFEVDEFHGENEGLVIAEVELSRPDEPFSSPPFIGKEVTGDHRYYNSHLTIHPFSLWKS